MSDLLNIESWSVLQWVLVVLVAGFIGQFGKSFAQFIMAKVKARRTAGKTAATPPGPVEGGEMPPEINAAPAEKQKAPPAGPYPESGANNAGKIGTDKKALKTILKQRKKEAKLAKKNT